MQAGLPPPFWDLAAQYACHAHNITTDAAGNNPWYLKHGKKFQGQSIPFGALIKFIPNTTTKISREMPKFAPTAMDGVFLGYELRRGNKWRRAYRVAALSEFADISYNVFADRKRCKVHIQVVGEVSVVDAKRVGGVGDSASHAGKTVRECIPQAGPLQWWIFPCRER